MISVLISYEEISASLLSGAGEHVAIFQFTANDSPELHIIGETEKVCVEVGISFVKETVIVCNRNN